LILPSELTSEAFKNYEDTLEADLPEDSDAKGVWVDELKSVRDSVRIVWTAAETVPV
jgi:hypothetical protein